MRHQVYGKKLNRDIKERKALFKGLTLALIINGKIHTTISKAKAVSSLIEKLVTQAKIGSDTATRQVSSFLARREVIQKFIGEIIPRFKDKIGGYLRIRRVGKRIGDNAEEVVLEWTVPEEKKEKKVGKTVEKNKSLDKSKKGKE